MTLKIVSGIGTGVRGLSHGRCLDVALGAAVGLEAGTQEGVVDE
jgi:hypothetical protein